MTACSAGSGLAMKFAFYGADNAAGVRRCRITTRWITDAEDMAGVMDRAECNCGCYVNIRDVLAQAVKEPGAGQVLEDKDAARRERALE